MTEDLERLRKYFQALSKNDKADFLSKLSTEAYIHARYHTDILLRENQIVTPGNWRYWLFIGGRGAGKSMSSAAELRKRVYKEQKGLALLTPTHEDFMKVMLPAIQKEFPDYHKPKYNMNKKMIECFNGITIDVRSSESGEQRGPNISFLACDELVKCWGGIPDKIEKNFAILDASVRKAGAQILITTTGERWPIFKKWYDLYNNKDSIIQIRSGKMSDNEYLSPQAVKALYNQYGNSRYEDLELNGIINFDVEGAIWSQKLIDSTRVSSIETAANPPNPNNQKRFNHPFDFFVKFALGVDPATTSNSNSDSWGIVVAGLGRDNHVYILEDHSKILSPNDAANTIVQLHQKYRNCQVIAESNQGGDMITYILRTKNPNLIPKLVHATQNKMTRAQPICIIWEQGRAHIVGKMHKLEEEMCNYTGDPSQKSPNVLDAMVYAAQFLMLEANMKPLNSWQPNFR
jgi:phage terminase large subunit-like protein